MTTEEIEVTTEQIENEEITFCDSCGADERNSELLTLTKNPEAVVETEDRYGHKRVGTARPGGSAASRLTDFELGRLKLEHEGTIDACEECLREQFNEEVVVDLFELEPHAGYTDEPHTGSEGEREVDRSNRAVLRYGVIALLWVLFPAQMFVLSNRPDNEPLHYDGVERLLSASCVLMVWAMYITILWVIFL